MRYNLVVWNRALKNPILQCDTWGTKEYCLKELKYIKNKNKVGFRGFLVDWGGKYGPMIIAELHLGDIRIYTPKPDTKDCIYNDYENRHQTCTTELGHRKSGEDCTFV